MLFKFSTLFRKPYSNILHLADKSKRADLDVAKPILYLLGAGTIASTFASFRMLYLNDTQLTDYAHLEYQPFENEACILPCTRPRA